MTHLVFIGDGRRVLVTNMFDVDGDETNDVSLVCWFVGSLPDGQWVAGKCSPEEIEEVDGEN